MKRIEPYSAFNLSRRSLPWLIGAVLGCAALATAPSPAPPKLAETGERISVELRALGTGQGTEGTLGNTDVVSAGGAALAVGETGIAYLGTGAFDTGGRSWPGDLCNSMCGGVDKENLEEVRRKVLKTAPHVWWAEFRALPAKVGQVALEVKWDHFFSEHVGAPVRIAGDTRRIVMNEGERHVLDFLASEKFEANNCYKNLSIDVTAKVQEDPVLAGEAIAYDVWLKHTDAAGVVTTRRHQAIGRQGEKIDFRFAPMRFPVPGAVLNDGSPLDWIVDGFGSAQGRMRSDGTIAVDVGVTRFVGAAAPGNPRTGGEGAGGRKEFSLASGETVSMVLPPTTGTYGYIDVSKPGRATGATVAQDDALKPGPPRIIPVDHAAFYRTQKDEVVFTAKRER